MKVTMLLADAAQAVGGKLYILGGGWSITGPMPVPSAIAIKIEVPWNLASRQHNIVLELLTADGQLVRLPAPPEGELQPIRVEGQFGTGIPAGLIEGTPIDATLALNIGPMPLPPGARYVWRLSIDGNTQEEWQVAFSTRPGIPGQMPPSRPAP
jgi:uncharacterized protein DUF6941